MTTPELLYIKIINITTYIHLSVRVCRCQPIQIELQVVQKILIEFRFWRTVYTDTDVSLDVVYCGGGA